jgi:hypothetical protein
VALTPTNVKKLQDREAKLNDQRKRCESLLEVLTKLADAGRTSLVWDRYESYCDFVRKTELDQDSKDHFIGEAKKASFVAHRTKLDQLLDQALDCARSGDQIKKITTLKLASQTLDQVRKLTDDQEFIEEVLKRIELAKETTKAGQSERAKNQPVEGWSTEAREGERRRFVRYEADGMVVRIGKETAVYRVIDFSLTGMKLDGLPPGARPGNKLSLTVIFETYPEEPPFSCTGQITHAAEPNGPTGIGFASADGPIMHYVRRRLLDLNDLHPTVSGDRRSEPSPSAKPPGSSDSNNRNQ